MGTILLYGKILVMCEVSNNNVECNGIHFPSLIMFFHFSSPCALVFYILSDCETQIMHKLQDYILKKSQVFFSVMEYAAELDW